MTSKKTRSIRAHERPSTKHGIHSRRLIRVSKERFESLNTLRFHCNLCRRWLPALNFYAQVSHPENETSDDAVCLERYEVIAEGFKGRETVVVCEDCAADMGQN